MKKLKKNTHLRRQACSAHFFYSLTIFVISVKIIIGLDAALDSLFDEVYKTKTVPKAEPLADVEIKKPDQKLGKSLLFFIFIFYLKYKHLYYSVINVYLQTIRSTKL
jgi:hypothetical protein